MPGFIPVGGGPVGSDARVTIAPPMPITMSKILGYAALSTPGAAQASKLVSTTILTLPDMEMSKIVSYALIFPNNAQDPQLIIMS
jgi:hypothetical protein